MRKNRVLFGLIGVLVSLLGVISCGPDYETEFEVKSLVVPDNSLAPVSLPLEGGDAVAEVETNVELTGWSASSNAAWLSVDKKEGKVTMSAGNNDTYAPRIARVTIEYGHQAYYINVSQVGKTPLLLVDGEREGIIKSVSEVETTISVQVKSNIVVDHILIPDTVDFVHIEAVTDVEGSVDEKTVTFKIDPNLGRGMRRYCSVTFQSSENYSHTASFLIAQAGFVRIPLTKDMLSTNAQEPREGPIENILDGSPETFFHSIWSSPINEAHYMQVTLNEPIETCYFWYQNRNSSGGEPTDVLIQVSSDGEQWRDLTHITAGLPTGSSSQYDSDILTADSPFTHFRFTVNKTSTGTAPRHFSMAEFKMYTLK
ncbi:discoidin domain-containing protein [Proteiniphilum saccharofermentans]|uniref:discoidin domain-containing protein n=1 Tax=Proteiniphilum saccharofermentans TaxID=1642647 RepID=UPI0028ACF4AE|nr:discoidin domain-containing protein [Proteiniphilum saccharofermentans]